MTNNTYSFFVRFLFVSFIFCFDSCKNYAEENSPTTGILKVYYDEGIETHVKNQAHTFESQYVNAHLFLAAIPESEAVQALYNDSCEAIVISRKLTEKEKKAFESKSYFPKFSAVAKSGVALITNIGSCIKKLTYVQVKRLLTEPFEIKDSTNTVVTLKVIFDQNNSSVIHYLKDSVLAGKNFSDNCNILNSTIESINYVATHKNTIAFVDFAWLSDIDDSLTKANKNKIKFICLSNAGNDSVFEYPDQSSFKLGTYPFTRTIYVYRKTGDFTLAKGFESFVAGPKGQLTFLKQGLLPARQGERKIEINTRSIGAE